MAERDITFGRLSHKIEDFTLDELQILAPVIDVYFAHMAKGESREGLSAAQKIIAQVLCKDIAEIGATKTDMDEMWEAVETIADLAGLKKLGERFRKEKEEREARAAASKAGTISTPNS
ncbi:MAG: hypothetical protein HY055_12725 [Magnetospirillum sp.]|nr:hypothetical protein [Magnetospirillum sp.]